MSFSRPTLQQLIERAQADIDSRLPGTDPRPRHSVRGALAKNSAAAFHGVYGYLDWLARQLFPDTAEAEYLARHASIWGVTRTPAAAAAGNVTFTGTTGTLIPAGTELQRSDGALYTTDAEATLASGTITTAVTAAVVGAAGNAAIGTTLTLTSPIAGVNATATVASGGLARGADEEDADALRIRLLAVIQAPAHGGNKADYERWALEVPGVTRAWVYPLEGGAGTVTVRFVRDDDASLIPDAGEVTTVQNYIDDLRPVTAAVTVAAPTAAPADYTIALTPNTQAVKDAVTAELADLHRREAAPGAIFLLSHIKEAISIAAGETNHVLTVPSADITPATGAIPTLGTITWA